MDKDGMTMTTTFQWADARTVSVPAQNVAPDADANVLYANTDLGLATKGSIVSGPIDTVLPQNTWHEVDLSYALREDMLGKVVAVELHAILVITATQATQTNLVMYAKRPGAAGDGHYIAQCAAWGEDSPRTNAVLLCPVTPENKMAFLWSYAAAPGARYGFRAWLAKVFWNP